MVNNFARYPVRISYTIDDEGKSPGGADYIDSLLPQFTSRNLKLSVAVVTGEQYASGDIPRIQAWFNAGHDINSHSWSHNYYDGPSMLNLKYTGTGTAATLTISGNLLTTTVTGGPGGENLSLDLTSADYASFRQLVSSHSWACVSRFRRRFGGEFRHDTRQRECGGHRTSTTLQVIVNRGISSCRISA